MPAKIEYLSSRRQSPEHWASLDDGKLMASVARGDKAAFAALTTRHLNPVIRYASRYIGTQSEAQDIAQETFIRLWKHAANWEERGFSLRSWIYRITYNLCIDELRKRRQMTPVEFDDSLASGDLPEQDIQRSQQQQQVTLALNELPERQRTAIILCVYQGMSNIDAAVVLDVSVDALESLLSRGRRALKKIILDFQDKGIHI
jgi:RNA polymerase sigma-70 factor (ECF subfamily)